MHSRVAAGFVAFALCACNAGSCANGGQTPGPGGEPRCPATDSAVHFDGPHTLTEAKVYGIFPRWPDGGYVRRDDGGLSLAMPGFRVEGEMAAPLCTLGQDAGASRVRAQAWFVDDLNGRNPQARDLAPGTYAVNLPWGTIWPPMRQVEFEAERYLPDGGRSYCGATAGTLTFTAVSPARVAGTFDFALGDERGVDAGEVTGWFDLAPCPPPARAH
jgi:hypothetical protein